MLLIIFSSFLRRLLSSDKPPSLRIPANNPFFVLSSPVFGNSESLSFSFWFASFSESESFDDSNVFVESNELFESDEIIDSLSTSLNDSLSLSDSDVRNDSLSLMDSDVLNYSLSLMDSEAAVLTVKEATLDSWTFPPIFTRT